MPRRKGRAALPGGTSVGVARAALESLAERGLIQAKGEKRGRVYHLSAATYKALGFAEAYVRTRGFEPLQQEQMVLQYVDAHGSIARSQAADLCQLSEGQASRLLTRMRQKGLLRTEGRPPKGAFYIRAKR